MSAKRVHVTVTGVVQGVFFRASTQEEASRRGVTGWVRNAPGGELEAEFQGDDDAVDALVEFCRHGPDAAQVHDVTVTTADVEPGERRFTVQ